MQVDDFLTLLETIEKSLPKDSPAMMLKNAYKRNPYTILMVTLLSLRARDEHTAKVAAQLFNTIQTPQELLAFPVAALEETIKPLGMQKQKARTLREVSEALIERFDGEVPKNKEALLSLKGVGEKTANIVINNAFDQGVIAVDTHVHRLCNFFGVIETKSDKESSKLLNEIIPQPYRSKLNFTLVVFGQTICTPKSPKCEICPVTHFCPKMFDRVG